MREIETNHIMVPDKKGRIFCKLRERVLKFTTEHYKEYCHGCRYFMGFGSGEGAVECIYADGSNDISATITKPESLVVNSGKARFFKKKA